MCVFRRLMMAAIVVTASLQSSYAITVKNTTLNTTIFSDDFENDTVGMVPDAPPSAGTWFFPNNTILSVGAAVKDDVSPGPNQGAKYLEVKRIGGNDSARAEAIFTPLADGETMKATFAFQYVSNGSSSTAISLLAGPANLSTTRVTIYAEADYAIPNFYSLRGNAFDNQVDTPFPVTPGQWQTIGIEYTQGSTDLKLTVDGASQVLTDAVLVDGAIDRIRFGNGAGGTDYSLDGISTLPSGDYNGDGLYDAADYVIWRKTDNSQAGYDAWRSKFGSTSGNGAGLMGATVPEPHVLGMLLVLATTGCVFRGVRGRHR